MTGAFLSIQERGFPVRLQSPADHAGFFDNA